MAEPPSHTVVALSTPPGRGGIGVVRLSGSQAVAIAEQIGRISLKPRTPQLAHFWTELGAIDQGLMIWFAKPHSFTGQDVVEFQGHGSPVALRELVNRCIALGARPAQPGEFSKLAFLNDKIDLTQAESIADLIEAGSAAAARAAARSLDGGLSRQIQALLEQLMELRVYCEAAIDFVDEDIEFLELEAFKTRLLACRDQVLTCLSNASASRRLGEGLKVVILGRPNAGKSSLLNLLVGSDRAIVTDIAGTTRDTLREQIDLDGLPLEITDTAGLNDQPDAVESLGIERALASAQRADLILLLFDDQQDTTSSIVALLNSYLPLRQIAQDQLLLVANKIDLSGRAGGYADGVLGLSVRSGAGLVELKQELKARANFTEQEPEFLARARHIDALQSAAEHLRLAVDLLQSKTAPELIAEELRFTHLDLQQITGVESADQFLGQIFSRFCIGK